MNCFFCNQPCVSVEDDGRWPPGEIWQCFNHNKTVKHYVHCSYHKAGDCDGPDCCPKKHFGCVTADWEYRNKSYEVTWFMPNSGEGWSRDSSVRIDQVKPKIDGYGRVIHEIQFFPKDLTPDNIDQKIPLWLNFL